MTRDDTYAVILAGGKGERFWPLSTARRPKQVLALFGGKPLLALAVERLEGLIPPERVLVITSADLADVTRAALPHLPPGNVIGEPCGRDTAAACALGDALVRARCPGGAFCILTADHIIQDLEVFRATLAAAFARARRDDVLLTIGIPPAGPSTGYGYIEAGEVLEAAPVEFRAARRFVEKPDAATAQAYVASGRYFWNSGMFVWSVAAFEAALRRHAPELLALVEALAPVAAAGGLAFAERLAVAYAGLRKISVDYALMEKSANIVMARGAFRWYDVGAWPALADHFPADAAGNVIVGRAEALDAARNIVVGEGGRLTALLGVHDLVVVHAANATLICPRDWAQEVKRIVQRLAARGDAADVL